MHRLPFPKSDTKSERIGKLIHADLSGPMQENSLGGARYFLMMMKDDYSHWKSLYFIKNKLETSQCLEDFFKKTDNHLKKRINIFRLDNSLEFVNKEIEELTCRYGITHQRTVPFTPEQNDSPNGKIEP